MKVLVIQVGNPIPEVDKKYHKNHYHYPSLIEGDVYFDEKQIINNVQTREGLEHLGVDVDFYFHTKRKQIIDLIKSSLALRKLVKELSPNITHVYWGGVSGFLAVLFCPGKTVVSLLGSDLFGSYSSGGKIIPSSRIQTLCSRFIGLLATRTVVMSERMKSFMWNSNSDHVKVIPEGVNLSKFTPGNRNEARKYLGWDEANFIVAFFYEGQAVKNALLAYESFELYQKKNKSSELKIINGFSHEELVYVYRGADVLLLTSLHEGSNNSIKEAMACNLPVVSVCCGDAEKRLGSVRNSFVTDYNCEDIAEKLALIENQGERSNGSEFIDFLSIRYCALKTEEMYREISENS